MKKMIICLLLSLFSPLLATESTQLDDKLRAEMQKLRSLSQNLELHLPASTEVVEDTISLRDAAIQREMPSKSPERELVQEDFALEALSLEELENPAPPTSLQSRRRVRSR